MNKLVVSCSVQRELWWQRQGLHNGRRTLPSSWLVGIGNETVARRRVYVFAVGNAGTAFIRYKGQRYSLDSDVPPIQNGDTLSPWGNA